MQFCRRLKTIAVLQTPTDITISSWNLTVSSGKMIQYVCLYVVRIKCLIEKQEGNRSLLQTVQNKISVWRLSDRLEARGICVPSQQCMDPLDVISLLIKQIAGKQSYHLKLQIFFLSIIIRIKCDYSRWLQIISIPQLSSYHYFLRRIIFKNINCINYIRHYTHDII